MRMSFIILETRKSRQVLSQNGTALTTTGSTLSSTGWVSLLGFSMSFVPSALLKLSATVCGL
jgi:hypothetical protein